MIQTRAVVVVNFGGHELIEQNFAGGEDPVCRTAKVYVVDNFHSTAERESITAVCARHDFVLIPQADNPGFASGCNIGTEMAVAEGARVVLLVNPDARVTGGVAEALAAEVLREPELVVSPRMVTSSGAPYFHGIRLDLLSGRMRGRPCPQPDLAAPIELSSAWPQRDWLTAACLAVSTELWRAIGGMDETYFLYWEDVDFSHRCVNAGGRLRLRNDLLVVHDEGATHGQVGSRARSNIYYYYNCRNRLLYAAHHLPRKLVLRWILRTPIESRQILLRGGRRQILQRPSCLWATLSGSMAGLLIACRRLLSVERESDREHQRQIGHQQWTEGQVPQRP